MQNTIATPHQKQTFKSPVLQSEYWPPAPLSALSAITQSSNQVMQKNKDGSIEGVRYVVMADPINLRPIRSWTINIEQWHCGNDADITANDILSVKILNKSAQDVCGYGDVVRDIIVSDKKIDMTPQSGFNAVMAAIVFISKIDAGRLPDIQKTLSLYNLPA